MDEALETPTIDDEMEQRLERWLVKFNNNLQFIFYVAEVDHGYLVGWCRGGQAIESHKIVDHETYDCEIHNIFLCKQYQHRGIGYELWKIVWNDILVSFQPKNFIVWSVDKQQTHQFYSSLGGVPKEKRKFDEECTLTAFVWHDLRFLSVNMVWNNIGDSIDVTQVSKSIVDDLNLVSERFIIYLPLIFLIFGFIGFIGNIFTYHLQAELRSNTCCIYSLCGSIIDIMNLSLNSFPMYLAAKYKIYIPWYTSRITCKLDVFLLVFLPHLSIHFSVMAIIDRFACTCKLTSPVRRLNQLKMVPWIITIIIISSCLASIYSPILYYLVNKYSCISTEPQLNSILYITLSGVMQPVIMLIFVLLTYQNVHQCHRRVTIREVINNGQFFFFVFSLTNNCCYINNVKSFYLSLLTSHLFRKTLIKGLIEILPRHLRSQYQVSQIQPSMATITRIRPRDISKR
ncbi:unnamed protein product [Rotaria sp. Silwood1]|nr:unnamed protein product [Rotaria sp. Silwood1]